MRLAPERAMNASEIANALGSGHRSGAWWRCCCPVHVSRGATLALRDGERGLIVVCHAGCARADLIVELRRLGLLGRGNGRHVEAAGRYAGADDCADDLARRMLLGRQIWNGAQRASGTPVVAYLASRGITTPVPSSLRWTPVLRRRDGNNGPAMVAIVQHGERGVVGVHRTWLDRSGSGCWRRLDRATLGPIGGGAVRLAPAGELLMVGEGIETSLAAMQATGMPAWAALSTSGLMALVLPPLPLAAIVVILADNDTNGAGERAARSAAVRWLGEGRRVKIAMPPEPGTDFNDVLMGRLSARVFDVAA
jgi:hypothetical protein